MSLGHMVGSCWGCREYEGLKYNRGKKGIVERFVQIPLTWKLRNESIQHALQRRYGDSLTLLNPIDRYCLTQEKALCCICVTLCLNTVHNVLKHSKGDEKEKVDSGQICQDLCGVPRVVWDNNRDPSFVLVGLWKDLKPGNSNSLPQGLKLKREQMKNNTD